AEPLPPVVRHRDPHQVGEGTRQLRTGTLARIGSRLPREQLVSERAGGVDLHARLALRGSAALQQLGREITLLVLGALLVETAQLHRARPVEVYDPRSYGGLPRRGPPGAHCLGERGRPCTQECCIGCGMLAVTGVAGRMPATDLPAKASASTGATGTMSAAAALSASGARCGSSPTG